ncbi:MAG: helix-turn-helix domain-containing protein [Treponema sp.]
MKHSVIIIEDEKLLRDELVLATPWDTFQFEVAGWADNGISGEELVKEKNPDLVITDIRMPGQSGLQLLEHIFVPFSLIITAYKDFDYACTALRIGVFDYLLKPLDDTVFYAVLSRIQEKLTAQKNTQIRHSSPYFDIPLPPDGNYIVKEACAFIEREFAGPISLYEAAISLNISESHLARLFKEQTGMTFVNYLTLYRLNRSITLMKDSRLNISEIAARSGFVSAGYYAKLLKKLTGMAPTEFRNTL